MGDMGETFKAMREAGKAAHGDWHKANMNVLEKSGLVFTITNKGECLLFRETGKPKVDFYPSTGRWRHGAMCHSGGAVKFLKWYENFEEGGEKS